MPQLFHPRLSNYQPRLEEQAKVIPENLTVKFLSLQGLEGQLVDRAGLALPEVGQLRFAVQRGALVAQKGGNFAFHLVERRRAGLQPEPRAAEAVWLLFRLAKAANSPGSSFKVSAISSARLRAAFLPPSSAINLGEGCSPPAG